MQIKKALDKKMHCVIIKGKMAINIIIIYFKYLKKYLCNHHRLDAIFIVSSLSAETVCTGVHK